MPNIDLNVRAGIDKSVLKDSERSIKDRLDAAAKDGGQSFTKIFETQLSKFSPQSFADNIGKDFGRSGQRAGAEFGRGLSGGVRTAARDFKAEFDTAIASATGGFGRLGSGATSVLGGIGTKGAVAAGGVLAVGTAAVTVTKQLHDAGAAWDDVVDGIAGKTGKVGTDLEKLTNTTKNVANTTASPIQDIADVVGSVSQATGLVGSDLQSLSKMVADFQRVTGQSLNMREAGRLFKLFDVRDLQSQSDALDELAKASFATGAPVDALVSATQRAGKAARSMGLDLGQTAALITTMEQAGLDFTRVEPSLTVALKNFAKAGREPSQALRDTIAEIKRLSDAGNTAAASSLAQQTFGRGFIDFLSAIRDGKLDVDSLDKALQGNGATIEELTEATSDWQEEWQKLSNTFTTAVEPAASATFSFMSGALEKLIEYGAIFSDTIEFWGKAWQGVATAIANNPIQMPQGPAVLGPDGTPIPAAQPAPQSNPLDAITGAPSNRPGTTLDDLLGVTPPGPPPALPPPNTTTPSGMPSRGSHYTDWYPSATTSYSSQTSAAAGTNYGYSSDDSLLARIPAGRYSQEGSANLVQGLGDCSSAIEDLIAIIDGQSTSGRSLSTYNAEEWLTAHGFVRGYMPGAFNVGYNSEHMQATLPGGTNFNWGSDAAAARRGIGGTGALDPAFTDHWYRPVSTGAYQGPLGSAGPTPVAVESISDAAGGSLFKSLGLDSDLGASRGVAGLIENAIKAVGMLAIAPLAAYNQTYGSGRPTGGLIGIARQTSAPQPSAPSFGPSFSAPSFPSAGPGFTPSMPAGGGGLASLFSPSVAQSAFPGSPSAPGGQSPFPGAAGAAAASPSAGPMSYGTPQQGGAWQPAGGGQFGIGGIAGAGLGAAKSAAGAAINAMAPGAGLAASAGMEMAQKVAERSISYAAQMGGLAVQGVEESLFQVGGASFSEGWAGRLLGAAAGAGFSLPNSAGNTQPAVESKKGGKDGLEAMQGDTNTTNSNNNTTYNLHVKESQSAREMVKELQYMKYQSGMR